MLYVICYTCILCVICYMLCVICFMAYAICYMLYTGTHHGNQHIILPQIGVAQDKIKNIMPYRGGTVCWKRHTGRPLCLDPMIKNIILPQIGLAQDKTKNIRPYRKATVCDNGIQGDHCMASCNLFKYMKAIRAPF